MFNLPVVNKWENLKFKIKSYKNLDKETKKKLKKLCRKTTGEILKVYPDHEIIIGFKNNNKVVCMCCISPFSPEYHFENEDEESPVPYIYNYLCDQKYRKHKISVSQMYYLKDYIRENDKFTIKEINLDILKENDHSLAFFMKNGFKIVGSYKNIATENEHNSLTFKLLFN